MMKPMYERYKVMEEFLHYHKIIDAADLAKILMDENFFPSIVRDAIEKCPAMDLFGDNDNQPNPYIVEEEGE